MTPLNWISKEDDIDLVIEYNTEDSVRDTISIDDVNTGETLTMNTFYYKHTIYFNLNEVSRTIYIDSEEYNLKIKFSREYVSLCFNQSKKLNYFLTFFFFLYFRPII